MAKQEYIKANREWLDANLRNRVVWDWLRIATSRSYRYICLVWIAFGWAISMRWSQSILECICVYGVRKNNVFFLVCKIVAIFAH